MLCLGAGIVAAQTPAPEPGAPARPLTALEQAVTAPTDFDIHCAGFFRHQELDDSGSVMGGEDGGLKNEFGDRDIIFLSPGEGRIRAPGGKYMLLRPVRDPGF